MLNKELKEHFAAWKKFVEHLPNKKKVPTQEILDLFSKHLTPICEELAEQNNILSQTVRDRESEIYRVKTSENKCAVALWNLNFDLGLDFKYGVDHPSQIANAIREKINTLT